MSDTERADALHDRRLRSQPWHSPPTWNGGKGAYLFTAACYEHRPIIGLDESRMWTFAEQLRDALQQRGTVTAWVVLPNHYHALMEAAEPVAVKSALKLLHGGASYTWNLEDGARGRKVWHAAAETRMKSDSHRWATINYIHHNPSKHGYAARWQDWPWSSALDFLQAVGRAEAIRIWKMYPIHEYGRDWDFYWVAGPLKRELQLVAD